ncbi:hypothetical protein METBIDRAFT_41672 [Metschnikowia bicuspidata var. bicuspidata NRRL YB-4993]|uniref:Hamartin n=1 Tax=Metschnikowia bicuspidata var. bicuspidata NRRL YB-4993 TaxID=869754 RepID=A0A1A0HBQ1_9ASCO|nr:hypothetical protein METBIDRAFT_41672 [Metschnikowia bicuspidata var. bicuspidata NRRL YB-4993]OBA21564.1 hypothetical protein METBIDRAFT_41672 [Metschnikowia bicuspidata var. bicuspidata NRRL YB-4993]
MSGSSRALQRALAGVFASWDCALDWKAEPSPQIKALYDTIYAYTERHNTLDTAAGSANDELRAAHEEHVKDSGDVSREVFFLELLTRLLPVLTEDQVLLWLRTYLRPAVDSAGFDLAFVAQARAFVRAVTSDVLATRDAALLQRRLAIALLVMATVARVYLGGSPAAHDVLGVHVLPAEAATQLHAERVRFIERNASAMLREWGLKNPQPFFSLLHGLYAAPALRAKVLGLAARAAASNVSQVLRMLDTPFFADVLRLLLLDRSESILGSCLSVLLMTVGKVCHRIAAFLPELLAVYTRLLLWKEHGALLSPADTDSGAWQIADGDNETCIMQTQVYADGHFNTLHLATVVYGLFPSNLLAFCRAPHEYTRRHPATKLALECKTVFACLEHDSNTRGALKAKAAPLLLRLMVHPNIINNVSLQDELSHPVRWILDKNKDEDIGEQEVLIECFALNPDILFSVPDDLVLPNRLLQKIQSANSLASDTSDPRFLTPSPPLLPANDGVFSSSKRGSFQLSVGSMGLSFDPKLPSHWLNMDRRVSIVPTRLTLENGLATQPHSPVQPRTEQGEIEFKPFDFDGNNSVHQDDTMLDDRSTEGKKNDHLSDLFTVHKKLYTSSATAASNQTIVNTDTAVSNTASSKRSASTVSDILTKQLQTEGKAEPHVENKDLQSAGNAVDFYQRELLLMKNELEFSSYMKNLNKMNYVKIKLKFNKMIRDQNLSACKKRQGEAHHIGDLEKIVASMKNLQVNSDNFKTKKAEEIKDLLTKVQALQNETIELRAVNEKSLSLLTREKLAFQRLQATLETKENMIRQLQHEIEVEVNALLKPAVEKDTKDKPASSIFLTEQEKITANFDNQLHIVKAQNKSLSAEIDKVASDLEMQKKNGTVELNKKCREIEEAFRTREVQYERKIKELNLIQSKYKVALDEKNLRIAELSKAKPIQIPGVGSRTRPSSALPLDPKPMTTRPQIFTGNTSGDYFGHASRQIVEGSDSHSPHVRDIRASETLRVHSASSIPIIRGRGGYQKRSKKFM